MTELKKIPSLPFDQVITIDMGSSVELQTPTLRPNRKVAIRYKVAVSEIPIDVTPPEPKSILHRVLPGPPKNEPKNEPVYGLVLRVIDSDGRSYAKQYYRYNEPISYDEYSDYEYEWTYESDGALWVEHSGVIEVPTGKQEEQYRIVLDNRSYPSRYHNGQINTQKIVSLSLKEISWKDNSPLKFSERIPAKSEQLRWFPVDRGDKIRIRVRMVSGDIDFYLTSCKGEPQKTNELYKTAYVKHPKTSGFEEIFDCTKNENLVIILDNTGSRFTAKTVNVTIDFIANLNESDAQEINAKTETPSEKITSTEHDSTGSPELQASSQIGKPALHNPVMKIPKATGNDSTRKRVLGVVKSFPRISISELAKYSGESIDSTRNMLFELIGDNLVSGRFDPVEDEFISAEAAAASREIKSESPSLARCMYCGKSLGRALISGEEFRCPSCSMVNVG